MKAHSFNEISDLILSLKFSTNFDLIFFLNFQTICFVHGRDGHTVFTRGPVFGPCPGGVIYEFEHLGSHPQAVLVGILGYSLSLLRWF